MRHGSNVIGEIPASPPTRSTTCSARRARAARRSSSRRSAVPMEGRGLLVDYSRGTASSTIYSATQSPHEVRLLAPPAGNPRAPRPRVMRDTGGGFGQKIMVQRDEMCLMLGAEGGHPLKWVEDRRETCSPPGSHATSTATPASRSTPTAPSRRPISTSCPTAAPTPHPGPSAPRNRGRAVPVRTACPVPVSPPRPCTRTGPAVAVPRSVAVRIAGP